MLPAPRDYPSGKAWLGGGTEKKKENKRKKKSKKPEHV